MTKLWLFNESKQVGVDYTDADLVSEYDKQHEGFRDFEAEARKIASALGLSKKSNVLDIGCGTGGLTVPLARMCNHIYAVDVSGAMIDVLRSKLADQKIDNVTAHQAGFLSYEHAQAPVDAIVANINLHHLPDFWKQIALCRFYDLLNATGKLFLADVVFGFNPRQYVGEIDSWLEGMKATAGDQMADEAVIHVRDEFSTWEWVMAGMLERAGFCIESDTEVMPHIRTYVCSKK